MTRITQFCVYTLFWLIDNDMRFLPKGIQGNLLYRVDHMFPPDINYPIPRNVCTLTKTILVEILLIVMDVVYNGIRQFVNKTSPSLYNEQKFMDRDRQVFWHTSIFKRNYLKNNEY